MQKYVRVRVPRSAPRKEDIMIPSGLDLLKSCIQDSKKSPIRLTSAEWLEKIPCKVYDPDTSTSYLIISVSNEGIWYKDSIEMYDDDSFFGDGYYYIDCPRLMKFQDMPFNLVFGDEPTEKQANWLEERGLMTESMTKQEAWLIINNAVKKTRESNEHAFQLYNQWRMKRRIDAMFDDNAIAGQCGGIDDDDYYDGQAYMDDLWD